MLFATHPEQAALVRERPELTRQAIEECLRYLHRFRNARRMVVDPIIAFGLDLKAGDTLS